MGGTIRRFRDGWGEFEVYFTKHKTLELDRTSMQGHFLLDFTGFAELIKFYRMNLDGDSREFFDKLTSFEPEEETIKD